MNRPSGRATDQLRAIRITRHYTKHAEGSVLVEFGDTVGDLHRQRRAGRAALPQGAGAG